jgi:hypothetical protein
MGNTVAKAILFSIASLINSYQPLSAQENRNPFENLGYPAALAEYGSFRLYVDDQVEDGCWTNKGPTENAIKLKMRQNDIIIRSFEEDNLSPTITLEARGGIQADTCFVLFQVRVIKSLNVRQYMTYEDRPGEYINGYGTFTLWQLNGAFNETRADSSDYLRARFLDLMDSFLVNYFEAVDAMKEVNPEMRWQWVAR